MVEPKIGRILVAVDFSEITDAVVAHGRFLARVLDAELKIIHVIQLPPLVETGAWMTPAISATVEDDIRSQVLGAVEARLNQISKRCGEECRQVEAIIREGRAHEQIIGCAAEIGADLIVVGTHGRSGLAGKIIGSVAERVVRRASYSVFCVSPRAIESLEGETA